jgi:hypothetical protein
MHGGAFHVMGGFGVDGTVDPGDLGCDLWRFDQGWRLVCDHGPPSARFPSLCAGAEGLYMFGGCGHDGDRVVFRDQIWRFDGDWSPVAVAEGPRPAARYSAAMAAIPGALVVFGGYGLDANGAKLFFGDLWVFDISRARWRRLRDDVAGPDRRYGFGWTATARNLYVFGGFDGLRDRADLWALDLDGFAWRRLDSGGTGPAARYCPALGVVDGALVLFGGRSKTRPKLNFSDTWLFDDGWRRDLGPGPGYHAKAGAASDGAALWLFGGEGPHGHLSDLWRYDDRGWHCPQRARGDDPILW